jgi:DNA repair protein SbcC/Rad50
MRPHVVVMQAFGPYAERQVIDFSELAGRSFFLIHGPTGAGKTTILDAMTFALFGVTSGDERRADDMRSHHASSGTCTVVEFDFSIGAQRYLIHRSPEQQRPKQRGSGFTTQLKEATLWRLAPGAGQAAASNEKPAASSGEPAASAAHEPAASRIPDPAADVDTAASGRTVLATGWSRVTEKCEELLGFKAAQFRQVVLLPQGRFQELLRSESRQRQEILETLFQTQIYRRVEEELKARAKDAGELVQRKRQEREIVLRQAAADSEDELIARRDQLSAQLEQARAATLSCEATEGAARLACEQAKAANDKLDELAQATERDAATQARAARVADMGRELDWARRAAQLTGPQKLVEERQADLLLAQERASQAAAKAARAAAVHELAKVALQEQEGEQRAAERTRLDEEVRRLTGMLVKAVDLGLAEDQQRASAEALQTADDQRQAAQQAAEHAAAGQKAAEEALRAAQQLAERLPELKAMAARSADLARARGRLAEAEEGLAVAERRVAEATGALAQAEAAHRRSAQGAADLERAWAGGQAALLAAGLHPGAPCPVCGSTEHPAPAHAERQVPGQAEVDAARGVAEQALATVRAAERALLDARNAAATEQAAATSCRDTLGDTAARHLADLLAEAVACQEQCTAAAAAAASLADLADAARLAGQAAVEAATAAEAVAAAQTTARSQADAAATLVTERSAGLPQELRTEAALQDAIAQARQRSADADLALKAAQQAERAAADAHASSAAALASAEEVRGDAQTALAEAQARFGELVEQLGFADELALAAARRTPDQVSALEADIREHQNERAAAADRLQRAAQAAHGLSRADVAPLLESLTSAEAAATQAVTAASGLQAQLNQLDASLATLSAVATELAGHEATFGIIGRLSQVASGDNQLRLSFQRFVLGALLDDVLAAATRRLAIMSRGRYLLQRADEPRDGRKAAGLDLSVLDEWTGMQRPVSTLSGGETFLAALSLALGLAEAVQAYAGGIHLDTVFVDEGFGSLDEEALAAALEALTGLQQGGRLVGIISHVSELQEQIDARLQITAGRSGSSARFIVP